MYMNKGKTRWLVMLVAATLPWTVCRAQEADILNLPAYKTVAGISGKLAVESGNIPDNLADVWLDRFAVYYPNIEPKLDTNSISAASFAMADASSPLAVMGRSMSEDELKAFEKRHGYRPLGIKVGHGAVVIYANTANPIEHIDLAQLDALFSLDRKCGEAQRIRTWKQLGVKGGVASNTIDITGMDTDSSVSQIFRNRALCGGDFGTDIQTLANPSAVQAVVSTDVNALGYSDMSETMMSVKRVAVGRTAKGPFVQAGLDDIRKGRYPLAHDFYIYVNQPPDKPLPPAEREFIRMVLSATGQRVMQEIGELPLSAAEIRQQRAVLDTAVSAAPAASLPESPGAGDGAGSRSAAGGKPAS
jgi:phosphate transport system substrate-binding protein